MIAVKDELLPEQFLHFVELDEFRSDWEQLGLDVEYDLLELQWELMRDPSKGAVIAGTGGLRKLRFAPSAWLIGKRGSVRVCYCWWPKHRMILLVLAYGKNRQTNISPAEREGIRRYLIRTEQWLDEQLKRRRTQA